MIKDGCQQILVKRADETKDCLSGISILAGRSAPYLFGAPSFKSPDLFEIAKQQMQANNFVSLPDIVQNQLNTNNMLTMTAWEPQSYNTPKIVEKTSPVVGNYIDRRFVHPEGLNFYRDPFDRLFVQM